MISSFIYEITDAASEGCIYYFGDRYFDWRGTPVPRWATTTPAPKGPHNAKGTAFSAVPFRVYYVTYSALSNVTLSSTPDFFMSSTILAKSSSDALITNLAFFAMPLNAFL